MDIVTPKKSHEKAPRNASEAQYKWPSGTEYQGDEWRATGDITGFNLADKWGIAMILLAVIGSAGVLILELTGAIK